MGPKLKICGMTGGGGRRGGGRFGGGAVLWSHWNNYIDVLGGAKPCLSVSASLCNIGGVSLLRVD